MAVYSGRDSQFMDWHGVVEAVVESGVESVGWGAFDGCKNLTLVTLGEEVKEIDWAAFIRCSKLATVTIERGVTKIGDNAFKGCGNLKEVRVSRTAE